MEGLRTDVTLRIARHSLRGFDFEEEEFVDDDGESGFGSGGGLTIS